MSSNTRRANTSSVSEELRQARAENLALLNNNKAQVTKLTNALTQCQNLHAGAVASIAEREKQVSNLTARVVAQTETIVVLTTTKCALEVQLNNAVALLEKKERQFSEERATLVRDKEREMAEVARLNAILRQRSGLALGTPRASTATTPARTTQLPTTATSPLSNKDIPDGMRVSFVRIYNGMIMANPNAPKKSIREWVISMNPIYANVKDCTVHQWIADINRGVVRGEKRPRDFQADASEETKAITSHILSILKPLAGLRAIFSSRHAWTVVESKWNIPLPTPSRTLVYNTMKQEGGHLEITAQESILPSGQQFIRTERYRNEYSYVRKHFKIHPKLIVNIDESAIRLVPTRQQSWVFDEVPTGDVLKMFPLNRVYTTLTAAVTQAGKKLPLMINWKGTDRLRLDNIDETMLVQFCQPETHWNTTVSFLFFVEKVVLPFCAEQWALMPDSEKGGYSPHCMLVIDCAPIHISLKTRVALDNLMSGKGYIVFLGAGCTDKTQPLDIGCFGGFKQTARTHHLDFLIKTLENRKHEERRKKNLATTSETRLMACLSLITAWRHVPESAIKNSWEVSMGTMTKVGKQFVKCSNESLDELIAKRFMEAEATIASQAVTRYAHETAVAAALAAGVEPPRHPEASTWIFRFGLPHGPVSTAEEATTDALVYADPIVRRATLQPPLAQPTSADGETDDNALPPPPTGTVYVRSIVQKGDDDEKDYTLPIARDSDEESDEDVDGDIVFEEMFPCATLRRFCC